MRHKKHNAAEAAEIQEMRKTMTLDAIAACKGVHRTVIHKILSEHGEARGAEPYRPKALKPWPVHVDFTPDELRVYA